MTLAPRKTEPAPDQLDSIIEQLNEVAESLSSFSSTAAVADTNTSVVASDSVRFLEGVEKELKIVKLYLAELTNEEFEASDIKD